jgi:iron complex outermembrane receptor protein
VQDEVTLHRRLSATLGARWDWWTPDRASVRPRVGLVYRTEHDLAVKLLYGEAFRAANAYELYYAESRSRPNPTLNPERLRTTELVFEQYLGGRVRVMAAAFATHIDHLIDQVDDGGSVYHLNRGRVEAKGLELEMEHRSASGVLVRASAVVERAIDVDMNHVLSNAPRRLGTLQLAVPVFSRQWTTAVDTSMVSQRETAAGTVLPGYVVSNATLTWRPAQRPYYVQGGVQNLFDVRYADPVGSEFVQQSILQDGRTASLKFVVRF